MKQIIALGALVFATLCFVLAARADEPKIRDQGVVYDGAKVPPCDLPPLRVQRREGCVEMDNGLVKARFTAGNDGVKQEYLASRGREWILLAESFRPDAAAAVADFASLFQATWSPHYLVAAYPFGGVSSQLGDAEWLDQRAHRFADPLVRIGLLTGRPDLIERGVAAARSSLTLANHPRHQANGIYTHTDFPIGLGPENIDHEGFPQRPLSSGPSWNSVGGLAGVAHLMNRLGGAYINFEKNLAVGVDGLKIVSFQRRGRTLRVKLENQLAALASPYEEPYAVELRIVGLPPGKYTLHINNQPARQVDTTELSHYSFIETPMHSPRHK